MKILRIIILVALVVSFMPLEAFCDDHKETTEHHHGIVICHGSCHGAILLNDATIKLQDIELSYNPQEGFIYEAPVLPTAERPPLSYLS